jgi:uncharacterized protein
MTEKRPYKRLQSIDGEGVHWTEGFWEERFALCCETVIPHMRQALEHPENAAAFVNFYIAAGLKDGVRQGVDWGDGDCYKWMEAASQVCAATGDKELDRQLDELIEVIGRAQEADGYICTQTQLTEKKRWTNKRYHELYNFGHLLTAACVHRAKTGKESFLGVARKAADHLYLVFQPRPDELAHFGWNPSNIMGLVDLYRATGEEKYLELAGIFVDMRGSKEWKRDDPQPDPGDQNQDRMPLRQEDKAVGHAVTATYLYCGATDVYAETGDEGLRDALERIWEDATYRKMYITGGVCPHHNGLSVRNDPVHEAFAGEYQLPNATAYNETCANIGHAMWSWRMLGVTGDSRYADVMEQVVYNSGLSGMSVDGKAFCYTNPLRWHGAEQELLSNDTASRWFVHKCYCCPPQVARTVARMHEWAYGLSEEGVWVHLYGGNRLEAEVVGGRLVLNQETRYPWEGRIVFTVEAAPEAEFSLFLRIPEWAGRAEIRVNGECFDGEVKPGTYVELKGGWAAGDEVEVELDMPVRLMAAHPRVEEARNQVAVARGPIVYCLESADLPAEVEIEEVHIPRNVELEAKYEADLLGGVTVLEGEAQRIKAPEWQGRLYQTIGEEAVRRLPVRLIPYFAWNNRGAVEMTVWLPRC